MMGKQHHTDHCEISRIFFLPVASPMHCFPASFGRANKESKGLKLLPSPADHEFHRVGLVFPEHPKRESCVTTPSSTLTQTSPAQ